MKGLVPAVILFGLFVWGIHDVRKFRIPRRPARRDDGRAESEGAVSSPRVSLSQARFDGRYRE